MSAIPSKIAPKIKSEHSLKSWAPPSLSTVPPSTQEAPAGPINTPSEVVLEDPEASKEPLPPKNSTSPAPIVFSSTPLPTAEKGLDIQEVDKKKWLKERWEKIKSDTTEKRLMAPMVFQATHDVNNALIEDNLSYFELHYQEVYPDNLEKALARACLCGSEKIAESLLNKLASSYADERYQYLVGYASASPNQEFAKKIARQMANAGLEMPGVVIKLGSYKLINEIKEIFKRPSDGSSSALSR